MTSGNVEAGPSARGSLQQALVRSWWLVFPCFTTLAARLAAERACADPYHLLPALTSDPRWAWPLAAVYVSAHAWLLSAYLLTVSDSQSLVPPMVTIRVLWGRDVSKLALMAGVFILEYSPAPLWRAVGRVIGCS